MEEWEVELRERLNKEIAEGTYPIGNKMVSKAHWIEFDIAMRREAKKCASDPKYFYDKYFKKD